MPIICPTVTAFDNHEYREQMEQISPFASHVHIDLMDGEFAPSKSPELEHIWWPQTMQADIHLMYRRPMDYLEQIIKLKPRLVIIHSEAEVNHMHFAAELHKENILSGIAVLQDTRPERAFQVMHSFDHVLVFSGNLGYHGGKANLSLLDKIKKIKEHHPEAEIGWDGGINDENILQLIKEGVDVLNVGGFIQKAKNPADAYATLKALADNRDD